MEFRIPDRLVQQQKHRLHRHDHALAGPVQVRPRRVHLRHRRQRPVHCRVRPGNQQPLRGELRPHQLRVRQDLHQDAHLRGERANRQHGVRHRPRQQELAQRPGVRAVRLNQQRGQDQDRLRHRVRILGRVGPRYLAEDCEQGADSKCDFTSWWVINITT